MRFHLNHSAILPCLLCFSVFATGVGAAPPLPTGQPDAPADRKQTSDGRKAVFGFVVSMDVKKRILTFKTEAGKNLKVRIAADVDFKRLDGKPNKLETLKQGHKVRVTYESTDDIPVVKQLLARVVSQEESSQSRKTSGVQTRNRSRGTFQARDKYNPRRAIVDAPFLKASEITDQVTDNELVLGIELSGHARAYPINMLTGPSREIINDAIGDAHLAATW